MVPSEAIRVYRRLGRQKGWSISVMGSDRGVCRILLGGRSSRRRGGPVPAWMEEVLRQLEEYFSQERKKFEVLLDEREGTDFQRRVWKACRAIPYGEVVSYGQLAERLGMPGAARAVGQALGRNSIPVITPCHRVVKTDRGLGGFSAGLAWKKRLLDLERH